MNLALRAQRVALWALARSSPGRLGVARAVIEDSKPQLMKIKIVGNARRIDRYFASND